MQTPEVGQARKRRFHERLSVLHHASLRQRLRQRFPQAFDGAWTRRQWIHASLFTTVGILVATIIPGFSNTLPPDRSHATLSLALPPLSAGRAAGLAGDSWQLVRIEPGQTLGAVFSTLGIPAATLQQVLGHPDARTALAKLRPGDEIAFDLPVGGTLRGVRFDRDDLTRVELHLDGDRLTETVSKRDVATREVVSSGEITSSLYNAGRKAGLSPSNITTLTDEIFKYDVDFDKDLQKGDRFSVVMDETWREGERIDTGRILAATFTTGGKTHSGFLFTRDGKAEYFDVDGRPLKKSFIRMPIPFARLSSTFGARNHPILGTMRMHKGVDYAASTGTPIMAAGDASVQFIGLQNGYGKVVILDHGQGRTTLYAHMSRQANLKKGQRVAQGTVIGYVGSTGMATGPHLHYEFRINGVHRNPLAVTLPPPEPLRGAALAQFRARTSPALARIRTVENLIYADASPAPTHTSAARADTGADAGVAMPVADAQRKAKGADATRTPASAAAKRAKRG